MKKGIVKWIGFVILLLSYPFGTLTAHSVIDFISNGKSYDWAEFGALETSWILYLALIGIALIILGNKQREQ